MLAICPKDVTHNMFITVAHVAEDWVVDKAGNFIRSYDDPHEVISKPQVENTWTCDICKTEAKVFDCDPNTSIGICPNCKANGPIKYSCRSCYQGTYQ